MSTSPPSSDHMEKDVESGISTNGTQRPMDVSREDKSDKSTLDTATGPPKPQAPPLMDVPDGGARAWMQVLGCFMLFLNSWGTVQSFGVYQTYYETSILQSSTPSNIAWIGGVQAFLLLFIGVLTGPLYDAGYMRVLVAVGSFLIVFGHMMLSLCTEYYQILLAQAFCIGLGPGCLYIPSIAILSTYFRKRLALSIGIAATGSSFGGVIYPVMLRRLIPEVGFGWAVRIVGFLCLATLTIANVVLKTRTLPKTKRRLIDPTALRDVPFIVFTIGMLLGFTGMFVPFYFIETFAIAKHMTNTDLAFYLISILNAASTFGRVMPNFVADRFGAMNCLAPIVIIGGVVVFCLIPVRSEAGIIVESLLYGFFSGGFVSLPPAILVKLSPNPALIGTRMGMCFFVGSFGFLTGTPVGGSLVANQGYTAVWIWGGALMVGSGVIIAFARITKVGWRLKVKF